MLLADLVAASAAVSGTRSRSRKVALLAELIGRLAPAEVPIGVRYLAGEPRQDRLEVGWSTLRDLDVAPAATATLTLPAVDAALERVAAVTGPGSRGARLELLTDLLSRATAEEQRFLRGLILRELRQGALAGVVTQAIAAASGSAEPLVRRAAMLTGDLAAVAVAALTGGDERLAGFRLELFRPLEPMLAQTAPTVADALAQLGTAAVEAKLDGARIQVHRRGAEIRVYTRNLREVTASVPEVVEAVRSLPVELAVLDGEAIALRADGRPEPFQVTMSRFGSELDAVEQRAATPLTPVFFDVLHLDGEDLLDRPLRDRLAALDRALPPDRRVERLETGDAAAGEGFLRATLAAGHEGVVVKDLDAPYEAGRRGAAWRKVKPAHTLDLVVLAAEWGSGRRRGWLSNLHLGARHDDGFVMLGKTFKGLTDAMLAWQTDRLLELETRRTEHVVHVRPELVVEIAFDGVQASSRYPGGVALRFARVKGYREDKRPDEADTLETIRAIHEGRHPPTM